MKKILILFVLIFASIYNAKSQQMFSFGLNTGVTVTSINKSPTFEMNQGKMGFNGQAWFRIGRKFFIQSGVGYSLTSMKINSLDSAYNFISNYKFANIPFLVGFKMFGSEKYFVRMMFGVTQSINSQLSSNILVNGFKLNGNPLSGRFGFGADLGHFTLDLIGDYSASQFLQSQPNKLSTASFNIGFKF